MPAASVKPSKNGHVSADGLHGHALRNFHLRQRSLARAEKAPPLARAVVRIRAAALRQTRLELARNSGISRAALRDLELGIHTPTRRVLQTFLGYCKKQRVDPLLLEEVDRLYTGPGETISELIGHLELRAGSPRELARRVGISPATLWEYRRQNFPLPLDVLRRLCHAVGEDSAGAEALWHRAERQRYRARGYPEAWAELCVWCGRQGSTPSRLLALGVTTTAFRRLRYLELPPWPEVAPAARALSVNQDELVSLQKLWVRDLQQQQRRERDLFGRGLKRLREEQRISRRELADLFGIGGKKPARVLKHIEEDGLYSAQAFPAGLVALLAEATQGDRLLQKWQERRTLFHRRRRPETRIPLRLARELYGLAPRDMEAVLGYSNLEYQRIERGVVALSESAQERILGAIHQAGRLRVEGLLRRRHALKDQERAWKSPESVAALIRLLARREGGLIPLARLLRRAGVRGFWPGRLRSIAQGNEVPAWPVLRRLAEACGVTDLEAVHEDWHERFRARLQARCPSPLGVELRLLIAETAATLRGLSPKLGFNYSVLIRDFQRIDRDLPLKWFHVERILQAVDVPPGSDRWRQVRALWSTAETRRKSNPRPLREQRACPA